MSNADSSYPSDPPENPFDLVLVVPTRAPIQIDASRIEQACSLLGPRLGCEVSLVDSNDTEDFNSPSPLHRSGKICNRVIITPLGFEPIPLEQIRAACWFGKIPAASKVYLAEPLSAREVGEWIGHRARSLQDSDRKPLVFPRVPIDHSDSTLTESQLETLALIAFWANGLSPNSVIYTEVPSEDTPGIHAEGASRFPWIDLDPEDLSTWMIQRYLRAVRSRAIPWNADSDGDWPMLNALQYQLQEQLPSEYAERLEEVSTRSMGSAKIAPDASGSVPWDKIWTSFCDLAMAGGPPHRGKLLEPVAIERIEQAPEAYRSVVAELQRGIRLASGLNTCPSPYLGWVCVECDSEPMAAWLMRAILVENISVRRESTKLYLPAGPDYRVDKEIKNVITSVAKTHHYWQAHLRSRQPPKPL
jgi:hypothetical protein